MIFICRNKWELYMCNAKQFFIMGKKLKNDEHLFAKSKMLK